MEENTVDVFTENIINAIDADVRASLTRKQMEAIREAISSKKYAKRHFIDLRLVVPFFFYKLYLVLLIGRDVRRSTKKKEGDRSNRFSLIGGVVFIFFIIIPVLIFMLFILYLLKSYAGINFMPDKHLMDLFNF